MNRSPAFQFYPDKWKSHTRRLSDSAYRVYHELICWMWESSPDYCSVDASHEAVACAVAMPIECVRNAFAEINNAFAPLLQCEDGRWISNGLRKEASKQNLRRNKAAESANARWNHANASKTHANASSKQCFPTPIPSPSPSSKNISFDAVALANRIISNKDGWHYDNCKVLSTGLKTRPLASVIEPMLEAGKSGDEIIRGWCKAVYIAHGATVDGLAKNPVAYAIQTFKDHVF
jgi:uncharacterized protein YdaU (DUF1376 family)